MVKKLSKNTSLDILNLDEGSIPFTRSTPLFLSIFAVFPSTVLRVSYEAPRISPVFRGFPSRNRNHGSGAGDLPLNHGIDSGWESLGKQG